MIKVRPLPAGLTPPKTLFSETSRSIARHRAQFPLRLFHAMAERVPAYKDFLRKNRIAPGKISTAADLSHVPAIGKKNYLRQYPLEALTWDGTLAGKKLIYTSSSGSTGEPFYFPRDASMDLRSSLLFELALRSMSRGKMKNTLFIVSFGMGVWIGGMISFQSIRRLADKGYPITVITPGSNKKEVFEALKRLAPMYEQVILGGYPPFAKDILDEAPEHGFDPKKTPLKVFCAAEGFGESFREYVMKKAGGTDPAFDTTNLYGTADIGTMAIETPVSIALRRAAIAEPALYGTLFSKASRLPTLAQFHPAVVDFTEQDGELLVSGQSALPLVRYSLGDHGGVIGYEDALAAVEKHASGFPKVSREAIRATPPLPFVYVYERADFSTKLYGAIIYAEHVKAGLQSPQIEKLVTGKFSMATMRDENENEYLDIDVEMKRGVCESEGCRSDVRQAIIDGLRKHNAEFTYLEGNLGERIAPRVKLRPFEDPAHFRPGGKQKWIKK